MKKQFLSLLEAHITHKSFDKMIEELIEYYFLEKELIEFLTSKKIHLRDKLEKLKTLEKKVTHELNKLLKSAKIKKSQNLMNKFLESIQKFYTNYLGFYPTNDELYFINKTTSAVKRSSEDLLKEIITDPIYFNYSQAFFDMKEAKFTIAREIRNYV